MDTLIEQGQHPAAGLGQGNLLPATNSYDLVPYESHPFRQTHPSRLAAMGLLFGMRPAPVSRCRVLELGCAAGGNLIPMAVQFPDSRFVGVDLSGRQVAEGQIIIDRLGLQNIELRHASILEVDESYGQFDYLICHGVFSWVPNEVQEKILAIAARNLHPQGIGYISYNTYPGWHMRGLIREMMRYHAENYSTPKIRTRQARSLLDFLAGSVPQDGGAFAALLKQEVEVLRHQPDHYLFHEHLEDLNVPLFFHQFIARAGAHQLQYLGEANLRSMMVMNLPEGVEKALRLLATDQIQLEQYMDFLRNRTFRETLLCHASLPLVRALDGEPMRRLWIASPAEQKEPVAIHTDEPAIFRTPSGYSLTTSLPLMKAAFTCLRESWPQAVSFERLYALATERLQAARPELKFAAEDLTAFASRLMSTYVGSDLLELSAGPLPFVTTVRDRPLACPYARDQAAIGPKATNRRHEVLRLNPVQQALLPLLDGKRDHGQLLQSLAETVAKDRLTIRRGDEEIEDPETVKKVLADALDTSLKELALAALLIG